MSEVKELLDSIIEGIAEVKGNKVVSLDLRPLEHAVCDYFIITDAESTTQVTSIAESVRKTVQENTGEKVWRETGYNNAQWILLDYGNIVVHVFQSEYREFYNLEGLWADAAAERFDDTF